MLKCLAKHKHPTLFVWTYSDEKKCNKIFTTSTKKVRNRSITLSELRRTIVIKQLAGVTKALHEKSYEFVVHVKNDYDYRMETQT